MRSSMFTIHGRDEHRRCTDEEFATPLDIDRTETGFHCRECRSTWRCESNFEPSDTGESYYCPRCHDQFGYEEGGTRATVADVLTFPPCRGRLFPLPEGETVRHCGTCARARFQTVLIRGRIPLNSRRPVQKCCLR